MIYIIIIIFIILFFVNNIRKVDSGLTKKQIINILIRQAARYTTAARQDNNSLVAVLHANYGAGYLWALRDVASDSEINKLGNIDINKFSYEITTTQDKVTMNMAKLCPEYAPEKSYLSHISGER